MTVQRTENRRSQTHDLESMWKNLTKIIANSTFDLKCNEYTNFVLLGVLWSVCSPASRPSVTFGEADCKKRMEINEKEFRCTQFLLKLPRNPLVKHHVNYDCLDLWRKLLEASFICSLDTVSFGDSFSKWNDNFSFFLNLYSVPTFAYSHVMGGFCQLLASLRIHK